MHRDGHVEVAKAYYSVPPEYLGPDGLGPLGRADGAGLQPSRWSRSPCMPSGEPGQFSTAGPHIACREDLRRGEGHGLAAGAGQPDRAAEADAGRSDAAGAGHRGRAGADGPDDLAKRHPTPSSIEQACQIGPDARGLPPAGRSGELIKRSADAPDAGAVRVYPRNTRSSATCPSYGPVGRGRPFSQEPVVLNPDRERNHMNESLQTLEEAAAVGPGPDLEVRLQEAAGNRPDHAEFLELILQDELAVRQRAADRAAGQGGRLPRAEDPG